MICHTRGSRPAAALLASATPSPTPGAAPAPAPALDALKNAGYHDCGGRLVDGRRTLPPIAPGIIEGVVSLTGATFGDVDGDGAGDAAAVLMTMSGGTGRFYSLVVVLSQNGAPGPTACVDLGDRVRIDSVEIVVPPSGTTSGGADVGPDNAAPGSGAKRSPGS